MKLKYSISIILAIILMFCFSCKNNSNQKSVLDQSREIQTLISEEFNWIIGTWSISNDDYEMTEIWEVGKDNDITALSYVLADGDTVFSENLRIHFIDNEYFLTVKVSDQNDGNSVSFKLIENKDGAFIFENTEHDFPKRIVYERISKNKLFAYIEGEQNGEYRREDFEFVRVE